VEFDRRCGTAQSEDCLQLYIPAPAALASHPPTPPAPTPPTAAAAAAAGGGDAGDGGGGGDGVESVSAWWPVLSRFHGVNGWPSSAVVLPGKDDDGKFCFLFVR